jgi:predicted secreted Zn-dependent protease
MLSAPIVELLDDGVAAIATDNPIIKTKATHLIIAVALDNFLNQRSPNITTSAHPKKTAIEIKSIHRSWKTPQFCNIGDVPPIKSIEKLPRINTII